MLALTACQPRGDPYLLEVQLCDILCGSWPWMRIEHCRARFPWIAVLLAHLGSERTVSFGQ